MNRRFDATRRIFVALPAARLCVGLLLVGVLLVGGLTGCGDAVSNESVKGVAIVNVSPEANPGSEVDVPTSTGVPGSDVLEWDSSAVGFVGFGDQLVIADPVVRVPSGSSPRRPDVPLVMEFADDLVVADVGTVAKKRRVQGSTPDPTPVARTGRYDPGLDVRRAITSALARAGVDSKLVVLSFGSASCVDCMSLETLLGTSAADTRLDERYLRVAVDVGRFDKNMRIAADYLDVIASGTPSLVVLDAKCRILGEADRDDLIVENVPDAAFLSGFLDRFS